MKSRGQLFVISAPSGAGKTTLIEALKQRVDLWVSVSHTTREKRPGEVDGVHYHFVDETTFDAMSKNDEFIEEAVVYGNRYGTSSRAINSTLEAGHDVIVEIDWQGAQTVRREIPDAYTIFIMPPERGVLEQRLIDRGQDSAETIEMRMTQLDEQMAHADEYHALLLNDTFDKMLDNLQMMFAHKGAVRCVQS